jgi:putative effector of murein hydrolase
MCSDIIYQYFFLIQHLHSTQLLKVAAIVVGGFVFTLFTTAGSVLAVRKFLPSSDIASTVQVAAEAITSQAPAPAPKAFSDTTALALKAIAAVAALLTVVATKMGSPTATDLSTVFMLSTTLSTFVFGARLPKKFTKIVHPLVICTVLTWLAMRIVGKFTGEAFRSMLVSYSAVGGAGKVLLNFLGPAVISLACQMYDRRKLMEENIGEVSAAIAVSSLGGLFGTAAFVRLLAIGSPNLRLSLLSRNITSPLAMAIAGILGADASLAVSMVVVTGLIGANFGASILDAVGIKDPVARGLGIGAAAHGLGTAAFANEKDAFPFAAIAMALTASACTCLVSVPPIKTAVMKLALGW